MKTSRYVPEPATIDDVMILTDVYFDVARESLRACLSEDDALALMVLLHTHRIRLREPTLDDRPGIVELAAITQRHAADVVAACWPNRADPERTDRTYWYYQFNTRTPFEVVDDIPPDWMVRIQHLQEVLRNVQTVSSLEPED